MRNSIALLSLLLAPFTTAQVVQPDGAIVPFTTGLPPCASYCGPLFDVQGACAPPNLPAVNTNCFCTDTRLTPFDTAGTTGVTNVCGLSSPFSCTATSDLQAIINWYNKYCGKATSAVTSTAPGGAVITSTVTASPSHVAGPGRQTWLDGHWKWVVMLLVVFFAIVVAWLAACCLRRRYIRKKERQIQMQPPVAWGPHQLQAATGGYNQGNPVTDVNRGGKAGAKLNEKGVSVTSTPAAVEREPKRDSRGLRKKTKA